MNLLLMSTRLFVRSMLLYAALLSSSALADYKIDLKAALRTARENAVELKKFVHKKNSATFRAESVRGVLDAQVNHQSSWSYDQKPMQGFTRESAKILIHNTNFQKLYKYGSKIKLEVEHRRSKLDFPKAAPNMPFDLSSSFEKNPEFFSMIKVEVTQPLWRNWLNREITLQRELAETAISTHHLDFQIQAQGIQFEVENLFIQLIEINKKIELSKSLVKLSKKFHKFMQRNVTYGHTDPINATAAKAQIVQLEGSLLGLKLAKSKIKKQLELRIYPKNTKKTKRDWILQPYIVPLLPIKVPSKNLRAIAAGRIDIAQLQNAKKPLLKKIDIINEENKFNLDAFVSSNTATIEDSFTQSFLKIGSKPSLTFGLKFSTKLGKTKNRKEYEAILEDLQYIKRQEEQIIQEIYNQLSIAIIDSEHAKTIRKQALKHIAVLKNQIILENARIEQARSDETSSLKYKMEIVQIKIKIVDTHIQERRIEAKQRFLTHSYPGR